MPLYGAAGDCPREVDGRMRLLHAPGTDAEWIIKKHGAYDINRESLGYDPATKAATMPVFMQLNHVDADKEGDTESATEKGIESRPRSRLPRGAATSSLSSGVTSALLTSLPLPTLSDNRPRHMDEFRTRCGCIRRVACVTCLDASLALYRLGLLCCVLGTSWL